MIDKQTTLAVKTALLHSGGNITELAKEFSVTRVFLSKLINGTEKSPRVEKMLRDWLAEQNIGGIKA